jgi:hypothetical protein
VHRFSWSYVDQCIAERPDWIVVALCDKNTVRSEYYNKVLERQGLPKAPIFKSEQFREMLANQKVDTVLVTTVNVTHHLYIIPTLEARGMHSDVHGPAPSCGPGQAGPKSRPDHGFGPARDFGKLKPSAQAADFERIF